MEKAVKTIVESGEDFRSAQFHLKIQGLFLNFQGLSNFSFHSFFKTNLIFIVQIEIKKWMFQPHVLLKGFFAKQRKEI